MYIREIKEEYLNINKKGIFSIIDFLDFFIISKYFNK